MDDNNFEEDKGTTPAPAADRDIPSIASSAPAKQYIMGGIILVLATLAIIFVVLDGIRKNKPKSFVQTEEISFKNAHTLGEPYIAPEPLLPEQETTQNTPSPAPDPLAVQRELALQREALRMAQEEKAKREKRLASPQLIYDKGATGQATPVNNANQPYGENSAAENDDPNITFANQYAHQDIETATASQLHNLDSLIPQGTLIGGILETAIQSDLPGMVRAIVSENIYSFDGSHLLIPKGAKLIGRYRSGVVRGQSRVFVIWNRLIRNDGVSINIGSYGTDALGRSGLTGDVDTHFFERFGSSVLLSMIDSGLKIGVQSMDNSDSATIALETGNDFSRASEIALQNSIAIPPTIHVDQGQRIKVFVGKDLDFSQVAGNSPRE